MNITKIETPNTNRKTASQEFAERLAYYAAQDIHGAEAYKALANDPRLPVNYLIDDVASISLLTPQTLKSWRTTGGGPASLRLSHTKVVYPRRDFCLWMADRFQRSMSA